MFCNQPSKNSFKFHFLVKLLKADKDAAATLIGHKNFLLKFYSENRLVFQWKVSSAQISTFHPRQKTKMSVCPSVVSSLLLERPNWCQISLILHSDLTLIKPMLSPPEHSR